MCVLCLQQPIAAKDQLGNDTHPYNAGPTGPLCSQGPLQEDLVNTIVGIKIRDTVTGIVKTVMVRQSRINYE
jgi:hypothetical protein